MMEMGENANVHDATCAQDQSTRKLLKNVVHVTDSSAKIRCALSVIQTVYNNSLGVVVFATQCEQSLTESKTLLLTEYYMNKLMPVSMIDK